MLDALEESQFYTQIKGSQMNVIKGLSHYLGKTCLFSLDIMMK